MTHVIISLQNCEFLPNFSKQDNTYIIKNSRQLYEHRHNLSPTISIFIKMNFVVIFLSTYPAPISCNVLTQIGQTNTFFDHAFSFDFERSDQSRKFINKTRYLEILRRKFLIRWYNYSSFGCQFLRKFN